MLEASIFITLKETVSDPQGLTIKHALRSMDYKEIEDVRFGKLLKVRLDLNDKEVARVKVEEMCRKLLANPVIEEYNFQIHEL